MKLALKPKAAQSSPYSDRGIKPYFSEHNCGERVDCTFQKFSNWQFVFSPCRAKSVATMLWQIRVKSVESSNIFLRYSCNIMFEYEALFKAWRKCTTILCQGMKFAVNGQRTFLYLSIDRYLKCISALKKYDAMPVNGLYQLRLSATKQMRWRACRQADRSLCGLIRVFSCHYPALSKGNMDFLGESRRLIRRHGCAGWSESFLLAHANYKEHLYVSSNIWSSKIIWPSRCIFSWPWVSDLQNTLNKDYTFH